MEYLQGQPREQIALFASCLDDMIPQNNTVRAIDRFVDLLNLGEMGFKTLSAQGRPPYNPADLLKLYIYGYMNRMRTSRVLEKECQRNLEVIWLLKTLKPDHNTIARFRKDNSGAIRRVFRQSVAMARNFNLIGGVLIAGDSTKLRAQNSKKNNFNKKKVKRHLDYIDRKLEEYNAELSRADGDQKQEIQQQIAKSKDQRRKYTKIHRQLEEAKGENPQISTSDPQSRHQIVRGTVTQVCYTSQITTDHRNKLLIDYKLTNQNDKKAMGNMLRRAKTILRPTGPLTALYDKGYHTGSELHTADQLGIGTLVAVPKIGRPSQAPDPAYNAEQFIYHRDTDTYTCPQGHTLTSNGTRYRARNYTFKQYKTRACRECPVRARCTTAKANGKIIQRSQYAENIENNARRVKQSGQLYRKRQTMVEHPFGTIKRQWGFDHILTKRGIERASADFGLIAIAYNLTRMVNIMGVKEMAEGMQKIARGSIALVLSIFKTIRRTLGAIETISESLGEHHKNQLPAKNLKYRNIILEHLSYF